MSTASLHLHLPDENELDNESQANAADAAELELAEDAAAAVEEGDEEEGGDIEEELSGELQDGEHQHLSWLVGVALDNGWQVVADEGNQVDGILSAPEGHRARRFAAEWKKVRYQGSVLRIPHWLERVLREDELTVDGDTSDDPEATLLEEPSDKEQASAEADAGEEQAADPQLSLSQSPARPLTPHQPPKSAALVAYEHRRAEARDRYEGTMFEFRKLEAAAKAAKERWKDAEDQLYAVLSEGGDFEEEGLAAEVASVESSHLPAAAAAVEKAGDSTAPTQAASEPDTAAAAVDPNTWRSVSISVLGLKSTLEEKLVDEGYGTIGKLEDLRAGFGGLKSLKGIGQAKADAIEDAILNWLSKNRDKEVLAVARGEVEEAEADQATQTPAEESAAPTPADELPSIQDMIFARAKTLFEEGGSLDMQLDDDRYFDGGWEAYNAGNELIDCPIDPAGPERDDWLRGWMSAKLTNEEGWQGPGSESGAE